MNWRTVTKNGQVVKYVCNGYTVCREPDGRWVASSHTTGEFCYGLPFLWYRDAQRHCEEDAVEKITEKLLQV